MIRGRKEGSTYASWFIGFDHELPPQSPRTPVHNKPVSRASSLETLLPAGQSKDPQSVRRSLTPVGTQTSLQTSTQTYTQTTEDSESQTPHAVSSQTYSHTTGEVGSQTRPILTQTYSQTTGEVGSQTRPILNKTYSQTAGEAETQTPHEVSIQTYTQTTDFGSQTQHRVSKQTYSQTTEQTGSQTPNNAFSQTYSQTTEEVGLPTRLAASNRTYSQTTEVVGSPTRLAVSKGTYTQTTGAAESQIPHEVPNRTYIQTTEETWSQTPHEVANQTYNQTSGTGLRTPPTVTTGNYTPTTQGIQPRASDRVPRNTTAGGSNDAFSKVADAVVDSESRSLVTRDRSLTPQDSNSHRSRRRREKDTQDIYKEAFDGAKRAEEFKFRVKFDKLIGDLHVSIEENSQNGLTSVTSPSYGDMMLTYKDRVKDLLKGFTQRLQIAYESFGAEDSAENTGQKVRQDVSRFIEELIGETVDLTSDEAVSDLSSLSDDSASEQNSFEDFIAQAVVSKLLESQIKGVNETVQLLHNNNFKKNHLKEPGTDTEDNIILGIEKDKLTSYDHSKSNQNFDPDNVDGYTNVTSKHERAGQITLHNGDNHSNSLVLNYKSDSIGSDTLYNSDKGSDSFRVLLGRKAADEDKIRSNNTGYKSDISHAVNRTEEINGFNGDATENYDSNEETDIVKEFEQLKAFVKQTRARPQIKAIPFDDSGLCEAREEPFLKTNVDRDEEREEFHTRYSVFDRIQNYQPALPDFSQFDNIDFESDDIDPDLLSMNLAIIPEETEEELEQEEEEDEHSRWKANWLFKGKGVSPYENMGKKTVGNDSEGSLYMMVPRPDDHYAPKIGHRDIDQLSEFSEHDLLGRGDLDGSDDEENTFYANTSEELARISGQHKRAGKFTRRSSGSYSDNSEIDGKSNRHKAEQLYNSAALDDTDSIHIPGPIVEPSRQDLKLLQDLVPAENDDPKFLVAPESVTVQEGEPVRFSCKVAGTSPIDVFWYREGDEVEELEESEDVEISSNGDKHSITIYNTSRQMAGQYMCIALNEQGKSIQYLVVTIKDNKQELKKPEFLKGLKDVDVTEGQSVKFRVKVKGYPPPRINWYKDGELLKNSKSCRIEKFGNRDYILTIDYASMNDDAEYTVSARNVAGEERMSAQVIVEPQSELPARKQRMSSTTTSGTSDSESEKSTPRRSFPSNGGLAPVPSAHILTPSKGTVQERYDQLQINHLDRKTATTRTKLNEEAQKMQGVAERDEPVERKRLITADALNVLKVADEIIEHEKTTAGHSSNSKVNGESLTPSIDIITQAERDTTSSSFKAFNSDSFIEDLGLPDTLDEFPLLTKESKTTAPAVSSLESTLFGGNSTNQFPKREHTPNSSLHGVNSLEPFDKVNVSQLNISQDSSPHNQKFTNVKSASLDISQGLSSANKSASALSSVATNSTEVDEENTALSISRQQMLREQYSRDFEVPHERGKKKWSVMLEPFSAQAELVNRQNEPERTNEKVNKLEINITDFSPSSLNQSPKGDASSQSSRSQSTDSGVSITSKQKRPSSVHMIGHTTEDEVPESRTEFNTDGSIELPSVNRLKAMFSSSQDDDLGDGSFKRIHSITARNVPKEKLEKLKAYNQNESSPSSSKFLDVPGASPSSSLPSSSVTLKMNNNPSPSPSTSASSMTLKPVQVSADSGPPPRQKTSHQPSTGPFRELDPDKDPVLIYPESDPEYMHRHHLHQQQLLQQQQKIPGDIRTLTKSTIPPQQNQRQQNQQRINPASTRSPLKPSQPQQTQSPVASTIGEDEKTVKKSGPRIRSGCISARAAFWERKIVDGGVVDDDFPEMVEDGDT